MKIIPLSEGSFTIDKTKMFVPFSTEDDLAQRKGSLLVEVQPFAIVTNTDILLLDAGLGFNTDGELQIHQNLKANGIEPSAVTKVLMTHLHKDHAGGVSLKDENGNYSLAFPKATYYVQQQELDYAVEVGFPSYMPEEIEVLKNNESVEILNGDGVIDGYIHYEISGGHCPYHQVFRIELDGYIIFFGGDVTPQLSQMKSRLMAKYDHDGKKSMELRHRWWEEGQQQDWTFVFYHDTKKPIWPIM